MVGLEGCKCGKGVGQSVYSQMSNECEVIRSKTTGIRGRAVLSRSSSSADRVADAPQRYGRLSAFVARESHQRLKQAPRSARPSWGKGTLPPPVKSAIIQRDC